MEKYEYLICLSFPSAPVHMSFHITCILFVFDNVLYPSQCVTGLLYLPLCNATIGDGTDSYVVLKAMAGNMDSELLLKFIDFEFY